MTIHHCRVAVTAEPPDSIIGACAARTHNVPAAEQDYRGRLSSASLRNVVPVMCRRVTTVAAALRAAVRYRYGQTVSDTVVITVSLTTL